ncbi:uncharacterized protein LOC117118966 [Anneissia japonica]|uniref:uncharacterized protein LOC117118966 n=1 Tax=Anneissia japonica TaxID=1529436 RepID=UPI0014257232|nr:uncharacterized protein LOC117118966 [Anneissia japonica]XP_033119607.1 uncharacterized protein LOC117118966 [Anneissia japonica]
MVRNRIRKTQRGKDLEILKREAAILLQAELDGTNCSIRSVAKTVGVAHCTLYRYMKKLKKDGPVVNIHDLHRRIERTHAGYAQARKVFSQEEDILVNYIKTSACVYFGLTPKDIRILAYECGVAHKKEMPDSWNDNGIAGRDWLTAFLKRHADLSIRTPEATSLGRAIGFNCHNVNQFFYKLGAVMDKYQFLPQNIYNVDETSLLTVPTKTAKVVAVKGEKQVGVITSGERGTLVTLCQAVSATGNAIPPHFIFPRVHFKDHMLTGAPAGSIGTANPSGWMKQEDFIVFMKHFIKTVRPSIEVPVLLLLDNHSSHLSIEVIDMARDNGVVMLSFPPHCSHKL